jgi:hypothetical protein
MENVAGEDLSWFWRGWFQYNWRFDQGINGIKYVKNDPKQGVIITVENFEKMPMPIIVDIKTKSGTVERVRLPVEIWQKNTEWAFKHNSTEEIQSITLDPDHVFPDSNESNNVWLFDKGFIEKDIILDGYLGTYSNMKTPMKITLIQKNNVLNAEITNYPSFSLESIGKDLFESKRAGLKFQFNEDQTSFDMIINDTQKIPFTKDK